MDYDNQASSQSRILDGDLETLTLQSTLKMLALGGKTGTLSVQSGSERLRIYLQDGAILSLEEPGIPEPDLIDLLRAMNRLGPEQIMRIPQDARRDLSSVMQFLVNVGDITVADELQWREFMVVQALSRAVRWERGRFEFMREASHVRRTGGMYTPSAAQPLNVDHVVLEALRLADEREHMPIQPASRMTRVRKAVPMGEDPRLSAVGAAELWIYTLAEERRPLYMIAYALLMPEGVAGAWLTNLLEHGLVLLVDERMDQDLERSLVYAVDPGAKPARSDLPLGARAVDAGADAGDGRMCECAAGASCAFCARAAGAWRGGARRGGPIHRSCGGAPGGLYPDGLSSNG